MGADSRAPERGHQMPAKGIRFGLQFDRDFDYGHNSGHIKGAFMSTIQASEFKAKCLALMDEVARTGQTIVVTKNGRPVAELHPHHPPRAKSLIGLHKGRIAIKGDIVSSMGAGLWDAMK